MTAPTRLRHRVGEAIVAHELWGPGHRVAVAVSGGLDSVVLLDLLRATAGWHRGALSVVTVDHGTRPGAAADAAFVLALARRAGIPALSIALGLAADASEDACRRARYRAFDALRVDRVALAHHRDDQAETVLLHLLRGTGTAGLGGMPRRRGRYVRPLLGIPRADLAAWARARGLSWREDPTNAAPRFLRNRLRHQVLPLLESLRPGAGAAIARAAEHAAHDEALLSEQARALAPGPDGFERDALLAAPRPLARRALLAALPGARATHLDAILATARRGHGRVHLPGGQVVRTQGAKIRVEPPASAAPAVVGSAGHGYPTRSRAARPTDPRET
jgi:tRNA(Ile)-lysidine synthase